MRKSITAIMLTASLIAASQDVAKAEAPEGSYEAALEGAESWIYIEAARLYCNEKAPTALAMKVADTIRPYLTISVSEAERRAIAGAHEYAVKLNDLGTLEEFCIFARHTFDRWR